VSLNQLSQKAFSTLYGGGCVSRKIVSRNTGEQSGYIIGYQYVISINRGVYFGELEDIVDGVRIC